MGHRQLLLATTAAGLVAGAAAAQTAPAAPAPEPQTTTLTEVIVTAEKRSANLQRVPLTVSAYTAETRQLIGLDSLQDLTRFTPGLTYSGDTDRVFLRGIGRQTNTNGSDPGVATYADGVYNASTSTASGSDFFIDRIEVLRGPQGTLYGRNSIGGAINAISKRPTDAFGGELRATVGTYGRADFEAAASGPINDALRFRIAGAHYNQSDGYFKNLAGGPDEGGVIRRSYAEGQLDADLSPTIHAWIKAFYNSSDTRPRSNNLAGSYDYSPFPSGAVMPGAAFGYLTAGYAAQGPAINPGQSDLRDFAANTPWRARLRDNAGVTLQAEWSLPGFDIKYIGGLQTYQFSYANDLDGTAMTAYTFPLTPGAEICSYVPGCTPLKVFPSEQFQYREKKTFQSHELNFASSGDGALQWIGGLYYYHESFDQAAHYAAPDQPQFRQPANGPANPNGDFVYAGSKLTTDSYAVFGQADWKLSPTFKLTGGLRYTYDEKSGDERFRILCFGLPTCGFPPNVYGSLTPALDITAASISYAPAPGVASPVTISPTTGQAQRGLSDHWSATTGTAGIEWTPDARTLAFLRYSRGYKSGGFNAGGISALPETRPEHVDAVELGYKRTLTSRLQANAAAFYYAYDGLQVPLTVTIPGGANMTQFFNLDRSVSYGVELEAIWRPIDPLTLMLSYGYDKTRIEKACCFIDGVDPLAQQPQAQPVGPLAGGQQPQSLVGQSLPGAPQNKVGLNASYRFGFSPGDLVVSASYTWKDQTWYSVFNRPYTRAPSYDQVDLRLVWTDAKARYRVIGFVKNLFDTVGYDGAQGTLLALAPTPYATLYSLTPPRTAGLQVQFNF